MDAPVARLWIGGSNSPTILCGREWRIGRSRDCEVFLDHLSVSRRHIRITWENGRYFAQDLGSRWGSLLNGQPLNGTRELRHDDQLHVGEVIVRFESQQPDEQLARQTLAHDRTIIGPSDGVSRHTGVRVLRIRPTPVSAALTIGRSNECGIVLPDPVVSSTHAEIRREGDGFTIRDLRSMNGTFVNGETVLGRFPLKAGDLIQIGPYSLRFDGAAVEGANDAQSVRIAAVRLGKTLGGTGQSLKPIAGISLVIEAGEFVGLLGESGSGKSTFLDAINGRRRATEGIVLFNDQNLYQHFEVFRSKIAYVPQDVIFHEQLSVHRAMFYSAKLRLPADTSRVEIESTIRDVLDTIDLQERAETRIANLSGGEKKRVAIGLELLARPAVLFLDEATSGLDHASEVRMMNLFRRLADEGSTVVCVTHYTDSLDACDLVAFFVRGRLAFFGSPSDLREYFEVHAIKDVYARAAERSPADWAERYSVSPYFEKYVAARQANQGQASTKLGRAQPDDTRGLVEKRSGPIDVVRQWQILVRRYAHVMSGDLWTLGLLLLQPVVIGLMIALICRGLTPAPSSPTDPMAPVAASERARVLLMLVTAVIWCGGMASGREVVKERTIYLHERFANLRPGAYLASKVPPLALICVTQAVVLYAITFATVDLGGNAVKQLGLLALTGGAAMLLGLTISCALEKQDQVASLFPVILVAQVVFSGGILPLKGVTEMIGKSVIPAYWSLNGLKATLPDALMNVSDPTTGLTFTEPAMFLQSVVALGVYSLLFLVGAHCLLLWRDRTLGLAS